VRLSAEPAESMHAKYPTAVPPAWLRLVVKEPAEADGGQCCSSLLANVQSLLARADRHQQLPEDYTDITEGLLASWKRRLKRKLLGNFKLAYVDVLSRQQSEFNQSIL